MKEESKRNTGGSLSKSKNNGRERSHQLTTKVPEKTRTATALVCSKLAEAQKETRGRDSEKKKLTQSQTMWSPDP